MLCYVNYTVLFLVLQDKLIILVFFAVYMYLSAGTDLKSF